MCRDRVDDFRLEARCFDQVLEVVWAGRGILALFLRIVSDSTVIDLCIGLDFTITQLTENQTLNEQDSLVSNIQ